jgi:hypothetical protein
MLSALEQFHENILRATELGNLVANLVILTKGALDVSDILRAELVQSVSALDHFVHELCRFGMVDVSKGMRPKTDAYLRYQIPISSVEAALGGQPHETWLGSAVREKHSWLSFQDPEKIANAIRLISSVSLWEEVAKELGSDSKTVRTRLELIVDRRNKIAHESDMDPANPGFRWPIVAGQVNDAVDFVKKIGDTIFRVVI